MSRSFQHQSRSRNPVTSKANLVMTIVDSRKPLTSDESGEMNGWWGCEKRKCFYPGNRGLGIIHLVRTQNFSKTTISHPLIRTLTFAYQGVRNVSFSENFAYVLNEWSFYANQRKYELHLEKKKEYLELWNFTAQSNTI